MGFQHQLEAFLLLLQLFDLSLQPRFLILQFVSLLYRISRKLGRWVLKVSKPEAGIPGKSLDCNSHEPLGENGHDFHQAPGVLGEIVYQFRHCFEAQRK